MTSAEHFISLITVASAKKLAAALILCFILYHGILHIIYGKIIYVIKFTHMFNVPVQKKLYNLGFQIQFRRASNSYFKIMNFSLRNITYF